MLSGCLQILKTRFSWTKMQKAMLKQLEIRLATCHTQGVVTLSWESFSKTSLEYRPVQTWHWMVECSSIKWSTNFWERLSPTRPFGSRKATIRTLFLAHIYIEQTKSFAVFVILTMSLFPMFISWLVPTQPSSKKILAKISLSCGMKWSEHTVKASTVFTHTFY